MIKHIHFSPTINKSLASKLVLASLLLTIVLCSRTKAEPFPANPPSLQTYTNHTKPNIGIVIDNSATMKSRVNYRDALRDPSNNRLLERPRRIDVVKDAALAIINEYYQDFNWSLAVIKDGWRDEHWHSRNISQVSSSNSGYLELRKLFSNAPSYHIKPYQECNKKGVCTLGLVPGTQNTTSRYQGLGFGYEEYLPIVSRSVNYKQTGKQLLVPFTNKNHVNNRAHLTESIKEIDLMTSVIQDVYPNMIDYMQDNIKYRCQQSFVIVLTDGNTITNSVNTKAAQKYSRTDAKTSGLDGDRKSFNAVDFPYQYIKTYAIGIGTNANKFKKFTTYGDGRAVTASSAEDVLDVLKEYVDEMKATNDIMMPSIPAVSSTLDINGVQLVGIVKTNPADWSSELQFYQGINGNDKYYSAGYKVGKAAVVISTESGLLDLNNPSDLTQFANLPKSSLGLALSQSIPKLAQWIIGGSMSDRDTGYRNRTVDQNDEKRFLGDVLGNSFTMVGENNDKIKAPNYLAVGSNDGMLKLYKANSDFGKYLGVTDVYDDEGESTGQKEAYYDEDIYHYVFAYLPGLAKKAGSDTILNTLHKRADINYGKPIGPPHQYGVNGALAYRTTNEGQTFMVGTLGQGGRAAYALNIGGVDQVMGQKIGLDASESTWKTSVPLWDTSSQKFGAAYEGSQKIGYTMGAPALGRIALQRDVLGNPDMYNDVRYIAAVSTGYHGDDAGPTLYIYDALGVNVALDKNTVVPNSKGKLIKKLTYNGTGLLHSSSLSAPILVDLDFDGVVDVAYAGDQNGNVYRFDFRGKTPDDWSVHLLYSGSSDKPIVSAPAFSRLGQKGVIVFGTGSQLYNSDFTVPLKRQSIYGVIDDFGISTAITENDLVKQDLTPLGIARDQRSVTNHPIKDKKGWYINFEGNYGESVTSSPKVTGGTVFFTTNIIQNKDIPEHGMMCFRSLIGPTSWLMQLNAATGGTLSDKNTHLADFVSGSGKDAINVAGKLFDKVILTEVVLTTLGQSRSVNNDGVQQSGNEPDEQLGSTAVPNDEDTLSVNNMSYEINYGKSEAVPKRIYLRKRF